MKVRAAEPADRAALERFLNEHWSRTVARLGELVDPLDHPQLVCEEDGELAGVATYVIEGDRCELLALHAEQRWHGAGTALVDRLDEVARAAGCSTVWVLTTNDNVDALRFYQRRGFRLKHLLPGGVDQARRLKPDIPEIGYHGIPLRDELVLEKRLAAEALQREY